MREGGTGSRQTEIATSIIALFECSIRRGTFEISANLLSTGGWDVERESEDGKDMRIREGTMDERAQFGGIGRREGV